MSQMQKTRLLYKISVQRQNCFISFLNNESRLKAALSINAGPEQEEKVVVI